MDGAFSKRRKARNPTGVFFMIVKRIFVIEARDLLDSVKYYRIILFNFVRIIRSVILIIILRRGIFGIFL